MVRGGALDVALDDPLAEMPRAREMAALPLLALAHVDQVERVARREAAVDVVDRQLADATAGGVDPTEEAGRRLHGHSRWKKWRMPWSRCDFRSAARRALASAVRCSRSPSSSSWRRARTPEMSSAIWARLESRSRKAARSMM